MSSYLRSPGAPDSGCARNVSHVDAPRRQLQEPETRIVDPREGLRRVVAQRGRGGPKERGDTLFVLPSLQCHPGVDGPAHLRQS